MVNYYFDTAMKTRLATFLVILFLSACDSHAPEAKVDIADKPKGNFSGKVVKVTDGDTIEVLWENQPVKVRLSDIDCPEKQQPFYQKAKDFTGSLCFNKQVNVINKGTDRYKRIIGEVELPDGKILNKELVKNGFAWQFKKYSTDKELAKLETDARGAHAGLWADAQPTPPWEWRHKD
jgi:micrococcal nuclease